jgi:hypothetical protein
MSPLHDNSMRDSNVASLALELDLYMILDGRQQVAGRVAIKGSAEAVGNQRDLRVRLSVVSIGEGRNVWEHETPPQFNGQAVEHSFSIPVGTFDGGYYTLRGVVTGPAAPAEISSELVFAIREVSARSLSPATMPLLTATEVLKFVDQTVERLITHQSARLGGSYTGILFITAAQPSHVSYRSIGAQVDGRFTSYWFPEQPLEHWPFRMDKDCWTVLDRLSTVTGNRRYSDLVSAMSRAFAEHGFHPKSGLAYLGEEADFDILCVQPVACASYPTPKFKPSYSGTDYPMPLGRLWQDMPQQTLRMCRASYYGMVTDPARMEYNRFCYYDFDDSARQHVSPPSSGDCAFDAAGAALIYLWSFAFAHSGDDEFLSWAQRMADKWMAVQDERSGLVPNFFGAVPSGGAIMPPGEWAESRGAASTAMRYLDAAMTLYPGRADSLRRQLVGMATHLARGVARFTYDPDRRIFREHLHLDGRPFEAAARYTFPTREQKQIAMLKDHSLEQVPVYDGTGLYRDCSYWQYCAGSDIPLHLASVAARTRDPELISLLTPIMRDIHEEFQRLEGAFTAEGRWTFHATGQYVRAMLYLWEATAEQHYLNWAAQMATGEMAHLRSVASPDWWRMPERWGMLNGLIALAAAMKKAM